MTRILLLALLLLLGIAVLVWAQRRAPSKPAAAAPPSSPSKTPTKTPATEDHGWKELGPEASRVVEACGTERPFSGRFVDHKETGTYTCTRCGAPLFGSDTKFDSRSGWPSFDDGLPGAVQELRDPDGMRVEIRCARCDGHLGHVFRGEGFTARDTRHCVNSISLDFSRQPLEEAFFAGGCFWGVEHLLESEPGVLMVESGYMGGTTKAPTYEQVLSKTTGHAETVRLRFDPTKTSYEALARVFFEIHDPTQRDRQGPDVGPQYRSAIFVTGDGQAATVKKLMGLLTGKGLDVVTEIQPAGVFWPAEDYHQNYYARTGKAPYCHVRTARF